MIASGPITIESQETEVIGFALITALDSASLMTHADVAQSFWDKVVVLDIEDKVAEITPKEFSLSQNYPNPFNPSTTIEFSLPKTEFTTLKLYNTLGQEVLTIVADKLNAGSYTYNFNARDLASGVYYYRLQAGEYVDTRKLVLMK